MPASIATLTELLGRIKEGTGADREIDLALWRLFFPEEAKPGRVPLPWRHLFTESIDATLALVERVLLDGRAVTDILSDALDRMGRTGWRPDLSLGPQLSRAILIELLTALVEGGDHADA